MPNGWAAIPQRPTGLMLKEPGAGVRYYRTGSAASAMGPAVLEGVPVAEARAVLVTGVTALISEAPHTAGLALLGSARGLRSSIQISVQDCGDPAAGPSWCSPSSRDATCS